MMGAKVVVDDLSAGVSEIDPGAGRQPWTTDEFLYGNTEMETMTGGFKDESLETFNEYPLVNIQKAIENGHL